MIEAETINATTGVERALLRESLAVIYSTGIIEAQIRKEKERIITGNADEPLEVAAQTLLDVRKKTQGLQAFQEICHRAYQENQNVPR